MSDDFRDATPEERAAVRAAMVPALQWSLTKLIDERPCATCGGQHELTLLSVVIDIDIDERDDLHDLGLALVNDDVRTSLRIGALSPEGASDIDGLIVEVYATAPDQSVTFAVAVGPLTPELCDALTHCDGVRMLTSAWPAACVARMPDDWADHLAAVRTSVALKASGDKLDTHAPCPVCLEPYVVGEGFTYHGVEYCTRSCAVRATGRY